MSCPFSSLSQSSLPIDTILPLFTRLGTFLNFYLTSTFNYYYRKEHQIYINLLRRHLETIYDPSMVEITFMKLMDQLELTKTISESHVKSYFDVSTSKIEESGISRLLLEIFDLNARNAEKDN